MKAVCFDSTHKLKVETVPDPRILNPRDAIIQVKATGICGSDLHLYNGFVPTMEKGDIIGHEFSGLVVEVGSGVRDLRVGDRVVVPSVVSCGGCFHCARQEWSLCDNSNPNAALAEKMYGFSAAGIYGYSHLFGGYAGSDAEYVRVPFADVGAFQIPDHLSYERAMFASDVLPTGMLAAENCNIRPGDTVAVWGCGPVGQASIIAAHLMGAERVIAIDRVASRLDKAHRFAHAEPLDFERVDIVEALTELTGGRGPDACIDAVGMEAHGLGLEGVFDKTKQLLKLENDRPSVLRQAIRACRKGGTISIVGVYSGMVDKIPMGAAMNKGLTFRMGQQHGQKYAPRLIQALSDGLIDPMYLVSHRLSLDDADDAFRMFNDKTDECMKIVLLPDLH